jgi:acyl carrier protein
VTDGVPSKEAIFAELQRVFSEEFGFAESTLLPETRIVDDLDLDSIDFVDMAVALEVRLGPKFLEDDLTNLRTLRDVVDIIHVKLSGAAP